MHLFFALLRIALGTGFVVAAIGKLKDPFGTRESLKEFGVPGWATAPAATMLSIIEIGTALLLILPTTARLGALAAFVLMGMFTLAMAINLAVGRKPACHCFGQISLRPIGWQTLARNVALTSTAGVLLISEHIDLSAWWPDEFASTKSIIVVTGLLVQAWFCLHLFRQNGRLLIRMDFLEHAVLNNGAVNSEHVLRGATIAQGLPVGEKAPYFHLPTLNGQYISLVDLLHSSKPLILVFMDPGCGPCTALAPMLLQWWAANDGIISLAVVSRGTASENKQSFERSWGLSAGPLVLLQRDREISSAFEVHGTPGAVLIRSDGTIGTPVGMGAEAIGVIMHEAAGANLAEIRTGAARESRRSVVGYP